jgi:hypothetical protein
LSIVFNNGRILIRLRSLYLLKHSLNIMTWRSSKYMLVLYFSLHDLEIIDWLMWRLIRLVEVVILWTNKLLNLVMDVAWNFILFMLAWLLTNFKSLLLFRVINHFKVIGWIMRILRIYIYLCVWNIVFWDLKLLYFELLYVSDELLIILADKSTVLLVHTA